MGKNSYDVSDQVLEQPNQDKTVDKTKLENKETENSTNDAESTQKKNIHTLKQYHSLLGMNSVSVLRIMACEQFLFCI